tara:strand:- start:27396 stop:27560 length:165 start_codon:yes stop_codon:yes gene_type:complete
LTQLRQYFVAQALKFFLHEGFKLLLVPEEWCQINGILDAVGIIDAVRVEEDELL